MQRAKGVERVFRGSGERDLSVLQFGLNEIERLPSRIDETAMAKLAIDELLSIDVDGFVRKLRSANCFKFHVASFSSSSSTAFAARQTTAAARNS
jgi:hypothetical protein